MSSTVVMAADSRFAMQLAVAIRSLAVSNASVVDRVAVLHDCLPPELRSRVDVSGGASFEIEWFDVSRVPLPDVTMSSHLSVASLYRCLTPLVLPAEFDRVLYLDADVVVRTSLRELFDLDLAGQIVGAVHDLWTPYLGVSTIPWRRCDVDPSAGYFNAGVMAISLDRWKRDDVHGHGATP